MGGIKNKIPNLRISAKNDNFNVLLEVIENYLGLYVMTCEPVIVDSYENGFVSVKPVLIRTNSTGQEIEITDDDMIYNVPVMKFGSNGWKINFKAKKGDFGLLIASKYDISKYKKEHKSSVVGSRRMFNVSDGFYLPLDWNEEDQEGLIISDGKTSLTLKENSVIIEGDKVNVKAKEVNIESDEAKINSITSTITSTQVNLGGISGVGVARIGDAVDLSTGKIIEGSTIVKAL